MNERVNEQEKNILKYLLIQKIIFFGADNLTLDAENKAVMGNLSDMQKLLWTYENIFFSDSPEYGWNFLEHWTVLCNNS